MIRPRVLLADDHKIVLEGLRNLLQPEFELVGTVENGRALITAAGRLDPDVIVVDISMPELNGIEATRELRQSGSRAKVIILTMHPDPTYVERALEAGAAGFVLKHSATSELVKAIHDALEGGIHISPAMEQVNSVTTDRAPTRLLRLTPRQRQVLRLVAEGRSAKEIGAELNISPRTVEFHKYRMMRDLQVRSQGELIQLAVRGGLISK